MIQFRVDEERCIQCGECSEECPTGIISMDDYPTITNEEGCYRCQHCLAVCPTGAISVLGVDPDASIMLEGNMPDPVSLEVLIKRLGIPENHLLGYAMAFGEPAVEFHRTVQRGPASVNVVR